jgi:hypothetical protein
MAAPPTPVPVPVPAPVAAPAPQPVPRDQRVAQLVAQLVDPNALRQVPAAALHAPSRQSSFNPAPQATSPARPKQQQLCMYACRWLLRCQPCSARAPQRPWRRCLRALLPPPSTQPTSPTSRAWWVWQQLSSWQLAAASAGQLPGMPGTTHRLSSSSSSSNRCAAWWGVHPHQAAWPAWSFLCAALAGTHWLRAVPHDTQQVHTAACCAHL